MNNLIREKTKRTVKDSYGFVTFIKQGILKN